MDKMAEKTLCITVSCRNGAGTFEGKTFCIDHGSDIRLMNCHNGSKVDFDDEYLKIGKCKIPIVSHNVFGGSWCAEDFWIKRYNLIKLFKHLKKTGKWSIEESTVTFEYWWGYKI